MHKYLLPFVLLLSIGLSRGVMAQPREDYPTYDPAQEVYMGIAAQLVGEDIKHVYGGDSWNDSLLISFDYVGYTVDTVETVRYHHEWNRLTDEGTFSGKLDDGRSFEVRFNSVSRRQGVMYIDSVPLTEAYQQSALNTAYGQFMYHYRWLLLPVQLVDSGVFLERLKDTTVGDKRVITLQATFSPDSTTPHTSFILYINPEYKNIERWRVSYNGSEQDYIWRLYKRINPFLISTKRYVEDFKSYIQLENIQIESLDKAKSARLIEEKKQREQRNN